MEHLTSAYANYERRYFVRQVTGREGVGTPYKIVPYIQYLPQFQVRVGARAMDFSKPRRLAGESP